MKNADFLADQQHGSTHISNSRDLREDCLGQGFYLKPRRAAPTTTAYAGPISFKDFSRIGG
ncbi:hypothetical protein LCGC14_0214420 [marine sediment metagenome]|uniref:Uncharacterized protein n=1 Tax=marine sediment metagenome TaxID=412755 RepID=A0A0F9UJF6_9ZZZZ